MFDEPDQPRRYEPNLFNYDPDNPQWLAAGSAEELLWVEITRLSAAGFAQMPFTAKGGGPANPPSAKIVAKKAMDVADSVVAGLRERQQMHKPGEPFFEVGVHPAECDCKGCRPDDEEVPTTAVTRSETHRKGLRGKKK
jgi:hypothetical protein